MFWAHLLARARLADRAGRACVISCEIRRRMLHDRADRVFRRGSHQLPEQPRQSSSPTYFIARRTPATPLILGHAARIPWLRVIRPRFVVVYRGIVHMGRRPRRFAVCSPGGRFTHGSSQLGGAQTRVQAPGRNIDGGLHLTRA